MTVNRWTVIRGRELNSKESVVIATHVCVCLRVAATAQVLVEGAGE